MIKARLKLRRKTTIQWSSSNEILLDGEIGIVTDVSPRQIKVGDNITRWNDLPFSTMSIKMLQSVAAIQTQLIAVSDPVGNLGKLTLNQLAQFIAPYVSLFGASPFEITTGTVLSNPITKPSAFTFVPAQISTQTTGGNVVTTAPLNVLFWTSNGTTGTWILGIPIVIDLSAYVLNTDINYLNPVYYIRQNTLTADESNFNGATAGRWGNVGTPPTFGLVGSKLRITLTSGQNQWLQIGGIYRLNTTYKVSLKARLISGTGGQVTFGIATGGVLANNIKFTPTSVEQTFTGTITTTSGATDLSLGTIAAQNTGQVYEFDDIIFYNEQPIDTKIEVLNQTVLNKQISRMENVEYALSNDVYNGSSIRDSLQFYSIVTPITSIVDFKSIKAKIWGTSTTRCTLRLYEAADYSTVLISQMKYIQEWKFGVGELNQLENNYEALTLDTNYKTTIGTNLVLFLFTEAGDNIRTSQLLPTDLGYASGAFYYILGVIGENPWYKVGVNPLSVTGAGSAKSEAIVLIDERYSTEREVSLVSPRNLLIDKLSDLTLTGWYTNNPYIEAIGDTIFANNRAVYAANTVVSEMDMYAKLRPIDGGINGLEFGIAKRSYLAGTAITIGHDGSISFLKIYRLETDIPNLVGTITLPFLVEVGATYQLRLGKRQAQMIIEIWKDTGEYYKKDDWYQASPDNPNFGGCWGHPTLYAVDGKIQAHSFNFITQLSTIPKLTAWGDSYIEASTLGADRSGSYINLFRSRLGNNQVSALGRGGETSTTVSNRFDWELEWFKYSKYCYLALGVNDSNYTNWLTAIKGLIAKVRSKGSIPILATITANTNGSNFAIMEQQNNWIRNVSGEIYVDVHKAVSAGGSNWKPGTVMNDGIHPTLLGHQFINNRMCYDLSFLL